ncbi:MAG: chemotaxis protein CheA [Planctomycetes bacterium]|nr:chemotaxis protein CheA [Planctomycetota bacterium]
MIQADDPIREEFVAEAVEHLVRVEEWLSQVRAGDGDEARSAIHSIFRAFHSIKGCAEYLSLDAIARLCHELETLLSLARNGDLEISPRIWDVTAEGASVLGAMVEDLAHCGGVDLAPILGRIRETVRSAARDDEVVRLTDTPLVVRVGGKPVGIEAKLYAAEKALQAGQRLYMLRVDLVRECDGKGRSPLDLLEWLSGVGDVLGTGVDPEFVPDVFETGELSVPFFIIYATLVEPGVFAGAADLDPSCVMLIDRAEGNVFDAVAHESGLADGGGADREVGSESAGVPPAVASPASPSPPGPEPAVHPEGGAGAPETCAGVPAGEATAASSRDRSPAFRSARAAAATIRVSVEALDRLLRLSGDLIVTRNGLARGTEEGDLAACARAAERLRGIESDLRQTILRTRMQPAGILFRRFPQLARDLGRETGKQVEVIVDGADVEFDRTAIEALVDPLTHLVRNAIDHGIESPEERCAAGKPAAGRLALRARRQGGHALVEIEDDGRGIDRARVREKAASLGILDPYSAANLSPRETLNLIFHPGLSTAKEVTKLSGRGVGTDVVKGNVERIGGSVEVTSEPGRGTVFRIKFPMALAVIPVAIFRCGRSWFAVPQARVRACARLRAAGRPDGARLPDADVLRLADRSVPAVRLRALANAGEGDADGGRYGLVLGASAGEFALIVDEVSDLGEIIATPFGRRLKGSPVFTGAAALGDGRVALMLDADGIVDHFRLGVLAPPGERSRRGAKGGSGESSPAPRLLLFESPSAPGQTFAVPFSSVERIDLVGPADVERVGGRTVIRVGGRAYPIGAIDSLARLVSCVPAERRPAIVISTEEGERAILADRVREAPEGAAPIECDRALPEGIACLSASDGRLIRVIDPPRIRVADAGACDGGSGGGSVPEGALEAAILEPVAGMP